MVGAGRVGLAVAKVWGLGVMVRGVAVVLYWMEAGVVGAILGLW